MEEREKFLPEMFKVINNVTYYRLEDGPIAVDKPSNVTISAKKSETVELVTFKSNKLQVNFWQIKDGIYPLTSKCSYPIPKGLKLTDIYNTKDYEGVYVKYSNNDSCEIIYVSDTEISEVISYQKGYKDISFNGECFIAKTHDDKYEFISQASKVIAKFDFECQKVKGFNLFYTENKIFIGDTEVKVDEKITLVDVISANNLKLIKVITDKGIYYYKGNLSKICGPLKEDEILTQDVKEGCYIVEKENDKYTSVFYIKDEESKIKSISDKDGITYSTIEIWYKRTLNIFTSKNKGIYINGLKKLMNDVDSYSHSDSYCNVVIFIGYKDKVIKKYCTVNIETFKIQTTNVDFLFNGIDYNDQKTFVCKTGEEILCITEKGEKVFQVKAEKCSIRKKILSDTKVYLLESDNEIAMYRANGTSCS